MCFSSPDNLRETLIHRKKKYEFACANEEGMRSTSRQSFIRFIFHHKRGGKAGKIFNFRNYFLACLRFHHTSHAVGFMMMFAKGETSVIWFLSHQASQPGWNHSELWEEKSHLIILFSSPLPGFSSFQKSSFLQYFIIFLYTFLAHNIWSNLSVFLAATHIYAAWKGRAKFSAFGIFFITSSFPVDLDWGGFFSRHIVDSPPFTSVHRCRYVFSI